jgi:hypothetical protein
MSLTSMLFWAVLAFDKSVVYADSRQSCWEQNEAAATYSTVLRSTRLTKKLTAGIYL